MRYMLMICGDESDPEKSPQEMRADPEGFSWFEEMDRRGVLRGGNRLRPASDATTVRVRGDEVLLSDGPFAEAREQMGGYDLIECADLEAPRRQVRRYRSEAPLGGVRPDVRAAVAEAFREEWGRVVATLIRTTGDWDLAEECAQGPSSGR